MSRSRLVKALLRPEAYPDPPDSVELIETHISLVFLAGERVYKVKKDVRMGFVDSRGLDRHRHLCEEEVRLNAALAPGIYLGTVPIAGDPLRIRGSGPAVEYAVEMVRLPETGMLDRLLRRQDGPDETVIRRIANLLREFHRDARIVTEPEEHGTPEVISYILRTVRDQGRAHAPAPLIDRIAAMQDEFLQAQREFLIERKRAGWVREGHGDLHAGNLCLVDDRILVYDRIEFAAQIRCCDVANDLAFLAMDLDRYGARERSAVLVEEYGPDAPPSLVDFYKVHRAAVRGAVGLMRGDVDDAARYFQLACGYTLPAALILTCGLPGSGKSTLARDLAAPLRADVLRSDVVRKRLAGIPQMERWKGGFFDGPYTPEMTERTYDTLLEEAQAALVAGRSVVVDATFLKQSWRKRFRDLASRHGHPFVVVCLEFSDELIRQRLKARLHSTEEVSDASYEVFQKARGSFEAPTELAGMERIDYRGKRTVREVIDDLLGRLGRQA